MCNSDNTTPDKKCTVENKKINLSKTSKFVNKDILSLELKNT